MGMVANMLRVSGEELEEYINNSSLLEDRIYSDDAPEDPKLLDIDKSWEGIFYMLTGKGIADIENMDSPLAGILFSEKVIDEDQDMGYGPANYIDAAEVKMLHKALQDISAEEFRKRYQPEVMNDRGIYPTGWAAGEEDAAYLVDHFVRMKDFYEKAANENNCVINFIS